MGRNRNPNQKPISGKKELSGAAKKGRKLETESSKKDLTAAAKFFRKDSAAATIAPVQPERETSVESHVETSAESNGIENPGVQIELQMAQPAIEPLEPDNSVEVRRIEIGALHDVIVEMKDFDPTDPSTWGSPILPSHQNVLLEKGPSYVEVRHYPKQGRHAFNPQYRIASDGTRRDWILYSRSTNSLFCFTCILFPGKNLSNSTWTNSGKTNTGFKNFAHQVSGIKTHEESDAHFQSTIAWREYSARSGSGNQLDQVAIQLHTEEISFWRQVLRGVIDAILYLAKNNLAFHGSSNQIGEPGCGNFLSLIELLSKYYSPLSVHVNRVKLSKTRTTYLSHKIQTEFIGITASSVLNTILESVRGSRYFSILFDATPDTSHCEQISQVVRYVQFTGDTCRIEESFLGFIQFDLKTGLELSKIILEKLKENGLDIQNCRGQCYDNGANMAGSYKGVQARIRELNPKAIFVPCAAHSLNLVGHHAATKILSAKLVLGQIQNLYNFFSASPFRWTFHRKHTKVNLKCQSSTMWSSKAVAVSALVQEFEGISEALIELSNSEESNAHTMAEANSHLDLIFNFKFLLACTIWDLILERINICNKALQTKDSTLNDAAKHLDGLLLWLIEFNQDGFRRALEMAKRVAEAFGIGEKSGFDTRISRGRKPKRFRSDTEADDCVNGSALEKFKVNFFDAVMAKLTEELQFRFSAIENAKKDFDFLWGKELASSTIQNLMGSAKKNAEDYKDDIKLDRFLKEVLFLKSAVKSFLKPDVSLEESTPIEILNVLTKHGLRQQFPNVVTGLQLFLTLPVSVASNERSFSKLKIIKNYLRSTLGQQKLSNLSILSIEHNLVNQLSFDSVIDEFASNKCRRVKI